MCEYNKKKRPWIKQFAKPEMLTADVMELGGEDVWDFMEEGYRPLPLQCHIYSYGYSCTDLSSLNNFAKGYRDTCLDTKSGSTGKTWSGNMSFVGKVKPLYIFMENVCAAMRGANFQRMLADLDREGYVLLCHQLNACDAGFPQDRRRAWFIAVRKDIFDSASSEELFMQAIESMKLETTLPLGKFLLAEDHPYLVDTMHERRLKKEKAAETKTKKVKVGFAAEKKRQKWKIDHWQCRRFLGLPAARAEPPAKVRRVSLSNSMCDREADLYDIVQECAQVDAQVNPTVELKHSAQRVVKRPKASGSRARGRQHKGSTSCLLPASKLLVLEPHVQSPRFMTGAEALSLQGIPFCYSTCDNAVPDSDLMSLAGNAFCGGCMAMMVLAGMISSTFPEDGCGLNAIFSPSEAAFA